MCLLFLIPRQSPAQGRVSVPTVGGGVPGCQEDWFRILAVLSLLGRDLVFVNATFLPPGSHGLWGRGPR